ncbi:MAG TPA: pseudouridine synthase [Terriglobales bacterium]|nr:pseudouridine synthase [Terriglobales bacterium]
MPTPGLPRRVGLARALSKLGFCSRSAACEWIRLGRVQLNGHVCLDPETPVLLKKDRIRVDGREVRPQKFVYLMLNKPRGIVTTAADEKGRDTVYSLLPPDLPWVAPAGRLDKASEGLLLLTNDSEWAARVTDPRSRLPKTYHVQIAASATESLLNTLQAGVRTAETEVLRASNAGILRHGAKNSWIEIVLHEGKNRHIRRMLDALGIEVLRLVRVRIGPLVLGDLKKGSVRILRGAEKPELDAAMRRS